MVDAETGEPLSDLACTLLFNSAPAVVGRLDADGYCRTGKTLTERPTHIATEAPPPVLR